MLCSGSGVGEEALGHRLAGDQQVGQLMVRESAEGDVERERVVRGADVGGKLAPFHGQASHQRAEDGMVG